METKWTSVRDKLRDAASQHAALTRLHDEAIARVAAQARRDAAAETRGELDALRRETWALRDQHVADVEAARSAFEEEAATLATESAAAEDEDVARRERLLREARAAAADAEDRAAKAEAGVTRARAELAAETAAAATREAALEEALARYRRELADAEERVRARGEAEVAARVGAAARKKINRRVKERVNDLERTLAEATEGGGADR